MSDLKAKIRARIRELEPSRGTVLNRKGAVIQINVPLALEQISVRSSLAELYGLLGETRPHYPCDDFDKE